MRSYKEIVEKINSIGKLGVKPSLDRIDFIMENLGNPQKNLKIVHVAGTNGKGTTSSYIASCLKESGYKTGLFTSPYVEDFCERIAINGENIPQNELIDLFDKVKQASSTLEKFSQFEFITAMAFLWFAKENCDVVVLEVGLGGRYDATNIISNPLVSVITSISLDHTAVLGDTIEQITMEKAGIIKKNCDVVLYPMQEKPVFDIIKKVAHEQNSALHIPNYKIDILEENLQGNKFSINNFTLQIPFSGNHQIQNAITAFNAIEVLQAKGFNISKQNIISGFKNTVIPARMELICQKPIVILDGGHNAGASIALKKLIEKNLQGKKATAIIGMMKDKDYSTYIKTVGSLFDNIIMVTLQNPRSASATELYECGKNYCKNIKIANNVYEAISLIEKPECLPECLIVCGSIFLAGEIRSLLKKEFLN